MAEPAPPELLFDREPMPELDPMPVELPELPEPRELDPDDELRELDPLLPEFED